MNKKVKEILMFIKEKWLGILLIVIGIVFIVRYGFLKLLVIAVYSWIVMFYMILKNVSANNIVRKMLKLTQFENEEKYKRKNKVYETQARENGFELKKKRFR